jgi:hypothetical protein
MDGKQYRALAVASAGILNTDTEGLTIATLASIGNKIAWPKVAADAAAATATAVTVIGVMPAVAGRAIQINYAPSAALTADATNFLTMTVRRNPAAGGAAVTIASVVTSAGSWTALVPVTLTLVNVALVSGDVLTVEITKSGTGVICPSGTLNCQLVLSDDMNSLTQGG